MNWVKNFLTSTIGRKFLIGLTGLLLIGFSMVHLSGNLLLFVGPSAYNEYAHNLHAFKLLILAEIFLFSLFIAHIAIAIQVTLDNRRARSQNYAVKKSKQGRSEWTPSVIMHISGAILLGFLILHLSDFTFELRLKGPDGESPFDKAWRILQNPISGPVYFIGSILLGWHLWHGFQSGFQTFGLSHSKYTPWIKRIGIFLSILLAIGFASLPLVAYLKKWGVL